MITKKELIHCIGFKKKVDQNNIRKTPLETANLDKATSLNKQAMIDLLTSRDK